MTPTKQPVLPVDTVPAVRWEYLVLENLSVPGEAAGPIQDVLNSYGAQGWELVCFVVSSEPSALTTKQGVFKRLKQH